MSYWTRLESRSGDDGRKHGLSNSWATSEMLLTWKGHAKRIDQCRTNKKVNDLTGKELCFQTDLLRNIENVFTLEGR